MPRFVVTGRFDADNIEDALAYLRDHFDKVLNDVLDTDRPVLIEVRKAEPGEVVVLYAE